MSQDCRTINVPQCSTIPEQVCSTGMMMMMVVVMVVVVMVVVMMVVVVLLLVYNAMS